MKLPTCPYCNTVYRYKEVRQSIFKKEIICYHCKKKFRVVKTPLLILAFILIALTLVIDVVELYISPALNFGLLVTSNIVLILLTIILIPYFVLYSKFKKDLKKKAN